MAAHGSEAEPGGAGGLWVAGTRKELVCWFSLKAQAVGINRSTQGGLQKEQVALGPMKGSLWRSSLQPPPRGHKNRRAIVADATLYCTVIRHK